MRRDRLRVVPHFFSGIVERAKRVFLAWGDFHARSRFAHSTIPEEKWGTTRSLAAGCFGVGRRSTKDLEQYLP